jgi:glycosyltransferase involved in cell wall biosynthesis
LKNILLVHNSADIYGASRSLLRLAQRLDRSRFTPIVLLPEKGPLQKLLADSGIEVLVFPRLRVITRPVLRSPSLVPWLLGFVPSAQALARLAREKNIALIHTNTGVICNSALAARFAGIPHIWHIRDWFQEFGPLWKPYSRYILALSQKVLCVSRAIAGQFPPSPKIEVLNNGIDLSEFPPITPQERHEARKSFGFSESDLVAGTVGRLKFFRKGQEFLIQAAAQLQAQGKPVKLLLAGGPAPGAEDHFERMRQLADQLGLADRVVFTGELANTRPAYAAMDIFVLPSAQPEPFGGVVMEAMSLGLPVIGTNIGGTPDQIAEGETGLLVPPADPEALTTALLRLVENPTLRDSLAQAARPRIQTRFPISETIRHIEESYLQAVTR